MILTIWRHGEAGRAASDRRRELTDRGIDDIGFACPQFHAACEARQLPSPDLILHSPWLRTAQTAGIIASAFTHAQLRSHQALQPGSGPPQVDSLLESLLCGEDCPRHLLLVSHQPLVSRLVERYLGEPGQVPVLSPGGLASLELDAAGPGVGRLLFWAMPPEYETSI
jgi:phosphohistidine phosphatase